MRVISTLLNSVHVTVSSFEELFDNLDAIESLLLSTNCNTSILVVKVRETVDAESIVNSKAAIFQIGVFEVICEAFDKKCIRYRCIKREHEL